MYRRCCQQAVETFHILPWHCVTSVDIHCSFRCFIVSELSVCVMSTLLDLSLPPTRTFIPTLHRSRITRISLFRSYSRHPVFARARHSEFMLFTNIHGRFTFFCKNISTDPHSGMSRLPWLSPWSRAVTELPTPDEGYAHSRTVTCFPLFHIRHPTEVYFLIFLLRTLPCSIL